MIIDRFNELCRGNYYATTIHAINSCLLKLSKVTAAAPVYRGVGGGALPKEFLEKNEHNVSAAVDMGFMSTTYERNVAVTYAGTGAATVFEMEMGMVDRGAQLDWLSQYPHEREILFPPLVGQQAMATRVKEGTLIVETRLNLNMQSLTLEEVVSKRKKVVQNLASNLLSEFVVICEKDGISVDKTKLIKTYQHIAEHFSGMQPEMYNNDKNYQSTISAMLSFSECASSWPAALKVN